MHNKSHQVPKNESATISEPAVAYRTKVSYSDSWNPNIPFHGTQDEWWEHFHRIEEGEFMTMEEADREFEIWKKELLASRI
jgi:hypothetical protein